MDLFNCGELLLKCHKAVGPWNTCLAVVLSVKHTDRFVNRLRSRKYSEQKSEINEPNLNSTNRTPKEDGYLDPASSKNSANNNFANNQKILSLLTGMESQRMRKLKRFPIVGGNKNQDTVDYKEQKFRSGNIVLDCSYEDYMDDNGIKYCSFQIQQLIRMNELHNVPFNLTLCNIEKSVHVINLLKMSPSYLVRNFISRNIHLGSYLDLYDAEKLIYLTPYASDTFEKYDVNVVYILGGSSVLTTVDNPASLIKAKESNVHSQRLPLDLFLSEKYKHFSLTLPEMMHILLATRNESDLSHALHPVLKRMNRYIDSRWNSVLHTISKQQASF